MGLSTVVMTLTVERWWRSSSSRASRARGRGRHLVAAGQELRHQPPPQDPGPACHTEGAR
ncbi:hypothetical protein T261_4513 [Streptomyces lydicus]|nr:hypothetical protein T261_4513 [Streptomyces lydicus]